MRLNSVVVCNSKTHGKLAHEGEIIWDNGFWTIPLSGGLKAIVIKDDTITIDGIMRVHFGEQEYSFSEYADDAKSTAVYPGQGTFVGLQYVTMKACGEAGEFAENVGKAMRDDDILDQLEDKPRPRFDYNELTAERRRKLIMELGDELWYLAAKADELGVRLADVALMNKQKLQRRAAEGKLQGSGSDR